MATQEHEISSGWPLGLQIMSMRLHAREALQAAPAMERYSLHMPSSSFSSFSSSNLDTESSASFFQDNSVSLGRLIGFKRRERGALYLPNSIDIKDRGKMPTRGAYLDASSSRSMDMSQGGICFPLLLGAIDKVSRSKIKSKQSDG